jgi:hypothetical protein
LTCGFTFVEHRWPAPGIPTRHEKDFHPPKDFMFQLNRAEFDNLKCQFGASSSSHGGRRKLPWAFTERGAVMAANVLNSSRAVQMSVFVVRAFLKMRALLGGTKELARQLKALEAKLTSRLDGQEAAIVDVLQRIMRLLDPPPQRRAAGPGALPFRVFRVVRGFSKPSLTPTTCLRRPAALNLQFAI